MKNVKLLVTLLVLFVCFASCKKDKEMIPEKNEIFKFIKEQTKNNIAVYGSKNVTKEAYDRAYNDIKFVLSKTNTKIKEGLFSSSVKMLVVQNEEELEKNIQFFKTLLPVESIYTNVEGKDETLASSSEVGLSSTKLELMYLCVYYSLLTEKDLESKFTELKKAYVEAADTKKIFTPGEAYKDGYIDEIHMNASNKKALKYGSYLFNLYKLYFGNDKGNPGEFIITTKNQLKTQNPLGFNFIKENFDL